MKKNIELKKKLYDNNFKKFGLNIRLSTTLISLSIIFIYLFISFTQKQYMYNAIGNIKMVILNNWGMLFALAINASLLLIILLPFFKKIANIKIGGQDAKPEFSRLAYYSMLFSAGVAIGLLFFAVYEPTMHLKSPLFQQGNYSDVIKGISTTIFHWSFGPWALYAVAGLGLAFYCYNKHLPLAPRSLLYPFIKEKIFGKIGDVVDALTIISSLFGLASSLGMGAIQINSGFKYLFNFPEKLSIQIIIIIFITLIATLSVVSGIKKGVKILSESNMFIAFALLALIIFIIPKITLFQNIVQSISLYFMGALDAFTNLSSYDTKFVNDWTIFYWAWWAAWSIFIGMFIARISRGRTIKEYIFATIIIPPIICFIWFGVFGTAANYSSIISGVKASEIFLKPEHSLFQLISILYKNKVLIASINMIVLILIFSFFITSSDSGSIVVDTLASAGDRKHSVVQKVFWASLEGIIAIAILMVGGQDAIAYLQKTLIILGLPIAILLLITIIGLVIQFIREIKNI